MNRIFMYGLGIGSDVVSGISEESPLIPVVILVSLAVIILSVWMMREFMFMPFHHIPKAEELKPRTIIGAGLGICSMIAMYRCGDIALLLENL